MEEVPDEEIVRDFHATFILDPNLTIPREEQPGHYHQENKQDSRENNVLSVSVDHHTWQADAHLKGCLPIRVSILLTLLLCLWVGEALISFRHLDELRCSLRVVLIPIRVILEGQLSIGFFDFNDRSIILHTQYLIRIEPNQLVIGFNVLVALIANGTAEEYDGDFDNKWP